MKIEFTAYHKWGDFLLNVLPFVFFGHEGNDYYAKEDTYIGIGWLCFAIEIHW